MGRVDLPDGPEDSPRPGGDQERRKSKNTNEGTRTPSLGIRSATRYHCARAAIITSVTENRLNITPSWVDESESSISLILTNIPDMESY